MAIKLIVGLRNPGKDYADTRHNAGGWFVEALANRHHVTFRVDKKAHGEVGQLNCESFSCHLLLPLVFMNHSGTSTRAVVEFFKLLPEEVLVAHDDLDLEVGRIKLKTGGGHGGHNGLRDLIQQLGHSDFHRLRVGIGHPGHKELVLNYVLSKPSVLDRQLIEDAITRAVEVTPLLLSGSLMKAMSQLNGG